MSEKVNIKISTTLRHVFSIDVPDEAKPNHSAQIYIARFYSRFLNRF